MAEERIYTESGSIDIDLFSGTWKSVYGVFAPGASMDEALSQLRTGEHIPTVKPLLAETSGDWSSAAEAIELALEKARLWRNDPIRYEPIWYKCRPDGAQALRYLIVGGYFQVIPMPGIDWQINSRLRRADLTMYLHKAPPEGNTERYIGTLPDYLSGGGTHSMAPAPPTVPAFGVGGAGLSTIGGALSIAGNGTRPGRIQVMALDADSGLTGAAITKVWAGIKPLHFEAGGATDFDPVQSFIATPASPFTNGTGGAGIDSYVYSELDYNGGAWGNAVQASIGGADDLRHYYGRYVALLRYKITAESGTDPVIRARLQYAASQDYYTEAVYLDNLAVMSTFGVVDMGIIQVPAGTGRVPLGATGASQTIRIQANMLTSGDTATVQFCRLVLIPYPIFCRLGAAAIQYFVGTPDTSYSTDIYTHADDSYEAITRGVTYARSGDAQANVQPEWYMPVEGGILVVAGAYSLGSWPDQALDVGMILRDRYISSRAP